MSKLLRRPTKPKAPNPPSLTVTSKETVFSMHGDDVISLDKVLEALPTGFDPVDVKVELVIDYYDYESASASVSFYYEREVPNPHLEKQTLRYKRDQLAYELKTKEYERALRAYELAVEARKKEVAGEEGRLREQIAELQRQLDELSEAESK